jgi:hypothetical protein
MIKLSGKDIANNIAHSVAVIEEVPRHPDIIWVEMAPGWKKRIFSFEKYGGVVKLGVGRREDDYWRWSSGDPALRVVRSSKEERQAFFRDQSEMSIRLSDIDRLRWTETVLGLRFSDVSPIEFKRHWFLVTAPTGVTSIDGSVAREFGVKVAIHVQEDQLAHSGVYVAYHDDPLVVHEWALAENLRIQPIYRPVP